MITAIDFLNELKEYVDIDPGLVRKAKKSGISNLTHMGLRRLIKDWDNGKYDDPELVLKKIDDFVTNLDLNA